ncbi:IclR family transcriptional regulator [Streptomyces lydicus]|uniref:Glycerol operon regulatory protein n=1 Tax=Streptomyces lydicus TaxID=47763 RepID=A0A3Q9KES8_9ACTN|nr:IclR family transcriptional regulator [Streptomyces lydicus]
MAPESRPGGSSPSVTPVSVISKLVAILEAFDDSAPCMTLSDLSRRTGIPVSTVHRLVRELVAWGGLERDDKGRYAIGLRLWEIGSLCTRGPGLREAAMPFIEDLYEATHENVQLAVLEGDQALYVERISGRHAVPVISRSGGRLPAYAAGVGIALLAHAPAEVQERILASPLRRLTPKTLTEPQQLRRAFAEVRRTGVAICNGYIDLESLSVAAPVFGPGRQVVAALSIVVPSEGTNPQIYVPAVLAAAHGISRVLGQAR